MRVSRIQTRRVSRIGARISSIPTTFARTGPAWLDGVEVPANTPRFPSQSGTVGLMVEESTTNLLTTNQASVETDTTGFTAIGSGTAISRDTAFAWTGAASLKVITTGSGTDEGVGITHITATQGSYAGQTRLRGTGTVKVWVRITYTDATNTEGTQTTVALTSSFQEVRAGVPTANGAKTVANVVIYIRTSGVQAVTFWVDGNQLENKAYHTSWQLPGTARGAETTTVPTNGLLTPSAGSVSILAYVAGDLLGTSVATHNLYDCASGPSTNRIAIYKAGGLWVARIVGGSGTAQNIAPSLSLSTGWHWFTLAWSAGSMEFWIDSVSRGTQSAPALPSSLHTVEQIGAAFNATAQYGQPIAAVIHHARTLSGAEVAATHAGSPPSDFTAYLDATKGQLTVNQGHPYQTAELLSLFMDAR